LKIALDVMGGDLAPVEPVKGALIAIKEFDVDIALVGPPELIQAELRKYGPQPRASIVPAGDNIGMEEERIVQAVRQRRDASINVATMLVRDGHADAVVSAGNTGAVMASAFFFLGRIPGIERPALGTLIPYNAGRVFLIDAGANTDCRPNHLVQFAEMGSAYSEKVVGVSRPRVGLLNVGEEAVKGNELAQETYERLKESSVNFIGNIEGVNVHKGVADVIVTDGFTGNIALKVGEGIADYILTQVRSVIKSNPIFAPAGLLLKPALRRALKSLQYEEYGGANLLGVNGVVVIGHGRSDALAIKNALRVARAAAISGLMDTMRASFSEPAEATPAGNS
jgi:glycerol-3-phosphate acyltransferase PlsX